MLAHRFKRRECLNTLLAMGFASKAAEEAADSTGYDTAAAVQKLTEGGTVKG